MTEQTLTLEQLMAQVAALNAEKAELSADKARLAAQNEQLRKSAPPFTVKFNISNPLEDGEGSKFYGSIIDNSTGVTHNYSLYERTNGKTGEIFYVGVYKGIYDPAAKKAA